MSALALFEYLTTLDQEVSAIWKRKLSGASLLLFAVRYTMLASVILSVYPIQTLTSPKGCICLTTLDDIFNVLGIFLTAAFSALRVYALCGRSVALSAVVLTLQLTPVVVNMYSNIATVIFVDPAFGCTQDFKFDNETLNALIFTARIPDIIGDLLVVIITWTKSFHQLRAQRHLEVRLPLSTLMFRDGTAYFLMLLTLDVLEMSPLSAANGGWFITSLAASLPVILVHRFMLNLRQLSTREAHSAVHICTISTPMFQASINVTGNMGESLDHGWDARDSGDEEELEAGEVPQGDEEARREDGLGIEEAPRDIGETGSSG